MQPNSGGFGPVHVGTATTSRTKKNGSQSQTLTVDVPLRIQREKNPHWSCYQNSVSSQSMLQNYKNFKSSGSPARLMQWTNGAWVELSGDALSRAKSAFLEQRPMVEVKIDGNDYIFDFFRMLQIDVGSGLQRSIAWIDVKGDCYFPKFFVDESLVDDDDDHEGVDASCDEAPKIEIEIKIDADNCKDNDNGSRCNKRKVKEVKLEADNEDTANSSCNNGKVGNSKRQRLVVPAGANPAPSAWPNAKLLSEGERSYSVVRHLFMNGMKRVNPNVRITSIHQFDRSGRMEKARWEIFQTHMRTMEAVRGRSNTVFAWHGTTKNDVFHILARGFGRPSKVSGSWAHGDGVYFSPARLPHLSDMLSDMDDNGEKHLVFCRVVLGNLEKTEAGSQQCEPSSPAFDSGADDLLNPKWYIVWSANMNTHILPECIVSYKCSSCQNGETMGVELLNWIPNGSGLVVAKLFSKLGSLLPAPKVEDLKALCMTYKAGKMAKDLFIKELKFVVGSEMLRYAISEIQSSN